MVGGRLLHGRLVAPQRPEPARVGEQRIDGEGQHAQQQAPAAGAAQRLHQQHPHDEARADHRPRRAAELPAELGRLAHVEHQVERELPIVPTNSSASYQGIRSSGAPSASREDQEREGQHAQDQQVVVFGVELRVADEEAQRELLVDAQEDGRRRRRDQQPAPEPVSLRTRVTSPSTGPLSAACGSANTTFRRRAAPMRRRRSSAGADIRLCLKWCAALRGRPHLARAAAGAAGRLFEHRIHAGLRQRRLAGRRSSPWRRRPCRRADWSSGTRPRQRPAHPGASRAPGCAPRARASRRPLPSARVTAPSW